MTDDILERFKELAPDPVTLSELPEQSFPELPATPARQRRSRRRAIGWSAVGGLCAVALAVTLVAGDSRGGAPVPNPLTVASAAAAERGDGGVVHMRTRGFGAVSAGDPPYSYYAPMLDETWVREDGSGRIKRTALPLVWPGPRDRTRATEQHDEIVGETETSRRVVVDEELSAPDMASAIASGAWPPPTELSADPDVLREQLLANVASPVPDSVGVFEAASRLLLSPVAGRDIRSAAFTLMSELPGVATRTHDSDPLGRAAASASISSDYTGASSTRTLFFDPETSTALAFTNTLDGAEPFIDARELESVTVLSIQDGT